MGLDLLRVAEILTPTQREDGTSGEGKYGEVCTGYLLTPELVLTCRHGVEPADREADFPIQLRWRDCNRERPTVVETAEAKVVWSDLRLDAALLRCVKPVSIPASTSCFGGAVKPSSKSSWSSLGFPQAGQEQFKPDAIRQLIDIQGQILDSSPQSKESFALGCDYQPVSDNGWRGASGAPIFQHDGRLVGVARKALNGFDGQQIFASPVWQMFEDPRFRHELDPGDEQRRKRLGKIMERTFTELQDEKPDVHGELIEFLNAGFDQKKEVSSLIESLIGQDYNSALEVMENHFRQARKAGKSDVLAQQLGLLACQVLTATFPVGRAEESEIGGASGIHPKLLDTGTGSSYSSGLEHAARLERMASFTPACDERGWHCDEMDVGGFPEVGPDGDGSLRAELVKTSLYSKLNGLNDDDFHRELDVRLASRNPSLVLEDGRINNTDWLGIDLAKRKKEYGEQFFLRHKSTATDEEKARISRLLNALGEDYDLLVHYLERPEQTKTEFEVYWLFHDMVDAALGNFDGYHRIRVD